MARTDAHAASPGADARRGWVALAFVLGGIAALRLLVILLGESAYGIAKYYMADDAFYYFQTARNFASGLGSTFDGVHVTNGYHPLWFLISTAVFAVVPGSSAPLMVLYALQIGLWIGSAIMLYLALKEIDRVSAAFCVALFLASWHSRKILFAGMESSLAFALASALLLLAVRRRSRFFTPATGREALGLFALLLSLSLARLEAGLLAAGWVCTALVVDARRGAYARRRILAIGLGLVVVGCAYVGTNLLMVGVPAPVSGLLKSSGHHTWDSARGVLLGHRDAFIGLIAPPGGSHLARWISAVEACALATSLIALFVGLRRRERDRVPGLVLLIVFVIAFVSISAFLTRGIWSWYRWPALLAGVVATFALVRFVLGRFRPVRLGLGLLALVTTVSLVPDWYLAVREHPLADWSPLRGFVMDETIRFIREQIPAQERIAGVSNGIFAYFSGRQIENLEGLANGVEFYRARRDPAAYAAYLRENRIRWIIFHAWSDDDRSRRFKRYVPESEVDRVYDLDSFYQLDLRRTAFLPDRPRVESLSAPNVYFVRLRP